MEEIQALLLRRFDHLPEKLKIRDDLERIHKKIGRRFVFCSVYAVTFSK
jgi:hypothetical protein